MANFDRVPAVYPTFAPVFDSSTLQSHKPRANYINWHVVTLSLTGRTSQLYTYPSELSADEN